MKYPQSTARIAFWTSLLGGALLTGSLSAQHPQDETDRPEPPASAQPQAGAAPASPVDPTGRPIDRGNGDNPSRINSSSAAENSDNSRPQVDRMGGVARGFSQAQTLEQFSRLEGKEVVAQGGDTLGELSDLVLDREGGQLRFVLVRTGGAFGIGGTERAIPFAALQPSAGQDQLTANLGEQDVESLPEVRDGNLAVLSTGGSMNAQPPPQSDTTPRNAATQLTLASQLQGKALRGVEQPIGEVQDVLINPDRETASLLVQVEDDLLESKENRFVIGFNRVNFAANSEAPLTSRLTAADFKGSARLTSTASISSGRPYLWRDSAERSSGASAGATRSSGGDTSAQQTRASGGSAAVAAGAGEGPVDETVRFKMGGETVAAAVRQALDKDEVREAAADVEVAMHGDGIVLSGEVKDAESRRLVVEAAKEAAQGRNVHDGLNQRSAAE